MLSYRLLLGSDHRVDLLKKALLRALVLLWLALLLVSQVSISLLLLLRVHVL